MPTPYESLLCYINQQSGARAGIFMNGSRLSTWGWSGEFSSPLCDLSVCFTILNGSLYLRCLGLDFAACPKWAPQNGHPSLLHILPNRISCVCPWLGNLWAFIIFPVYSFVSDPSFYRSIVRMFISPHPVVISLFARSGGLHVQHKSIPSCLCSGIIQQHFHFLRLPEAPGFKECNWVCACNIPDCKKLLENRKYCKELRLGPLVSLFVTVAIVTLENLWSCSPGLH